MKDSKRAGGGKPGTPAKGGKGKLLGFAAIPVVLALGGAGWYLLWPGAKFGHPAAPKAETHAAAALAQKPQVVDLPEIVVTVPNGGQPRQLRIKFTIELTPGAHNIPPPELLNPRINDALLAYLRTLRDGDLEGGLAIDRIRGDLYRRLTLVLAPNTVEDVLITSLVTG